MKKAILILGAAFVFAGCNQEQGGTSDNSTTSSGSTNNASSSRSSSRNAPTAPSSADTNQTPRSTP